MTLQEYGLDDIFQFEHNDDMDVLFIDEQRNNADEISLNEENMPAVTIFKNNQLGISINVEEHEEIDNNSSESRDTSKDSRVFENPFKKLERLASRSSLRHNENDKNFESISLVNSQEQTTKDSISSNSSSGLKSKKCSRRIQLDKKQIHQGRIYMFLEHPTGWICFVYHMGV